MAEMEIETQRRIELGYLRENMIQSRIAARINRLEGDVSVEQVAEWERAAYLQWRETYPALASMFPSVLPSSEPSR